MDGSRISIVVAIGRGGTHNRVLGKDNQLLWHIPDDLKRFKALTLGHPIIMGRKTFESIVGYLGKPLPGRTNIVVTRDPNWSYQNHQGDILMVHRASSVKEAIEIAKQQPGGEEIFIGGGGQIYDAALQYVDKLYLTIIDDDKEGDSFFPAYEDQFGNVVNEEHREYNGMKYTWIDLER